MKPDNTPRLPIPDLSYEHKDKLLRKERRLLSVPVAVISSAAAIIAILICAGVMFLDNTTPPNAHISTTFSQTDTPDTLAIESTSTTIELVEQELLDNTIASTVPCARSRSEIRTSDKTRIKDHNRVADTIPKIAPLSIPIKRESRAMLSTINPQIITVNINIKDTSIISPKNSTYVKSRHRMQTVTFLDGLKRSVSIEFNSLIEELSASNPFKRTISE